MVKRIQKILSLFFLLILMGTMSLTAQNTKRGYKLLEKADYEKSNAVFLDAVSDNPQNAPALFGLALTAADEKSPYYDPINAWDYASKVKKIMDSFTTDDLEYIGEYFINTETQHLSRPVKKKIEYAIETIEAKLIKYVREENNLDIVYKVLDKFPDFRYYENVLHIRNQLEFRKYEKQNLLEGYLEFISKFPEAAQIDKAKKYRDKLAFDKACQVNTVEAYRSYMKQYPDAEEKSMAIKKIYSVAFQDAKKKNTIQAFDDFISEYPDALEVSDAKLIRKQLLYENAKNIKTLDAYNAFIKEYPEGQQYIDIFNLKSADNGMRFYSSHPLSTNNFVWARSFDEEENRELSGCMTIDTLNSYIIGGTVFRSDTGFTDAWVLKLNADGKMIWNKYVGEAFNDGVDLLAVNQRNEILGAGYTCMGMDSSSRESWLFKLGPDGQKIWSRNVGKMHINNILISSTGTISLGGYQVNDSSGRKYAVVVLNENGKRLWTRTYTGKGEIVKISECPDKNILLTGNHWSAKINPKGYLIWENFFTPADSILAVQVLPKGEICYLSLRNHQKMILIKTSAENKALLDKELPLSEIPARVNSMIPGNQNQLIALFTNEHDQTINWIGTLKGDVPVSSFVPESLKIQEILADRNNNLLLVACGGQIVVIKNEGFAF
jgi:hypothetical protein